MRVRNPLILAVGILLGGASSQLLAEDDAATEAAVDNSTVAMAETDGGGGFFDLFGRKIDPDTEAMEGDMPDGPLKIVVDKNAPKFGSRKRGKSSSSRASRPSSAKRIQWSGNHESFVNSGASNSGATHLVKSGRRVYLRNY